MRTKTEVFFIASISFLAACAALLPAISQDQSYHAFADRRSWGFIPNAQALVDIFYNIDSRLGHNIIDRSVSPSHHHRPTLS